LQEWGKLTKAGLTCGTQQLHQGRDRHVSAANGRVTVQERFEGVPEASLQFEPDAGNHRRFRGTGDDRRVVAVAAERLEAERIYLSAAKTKPGSNMQAE